MNRTIIGIYAASMTLLFAGCSTVGEQAEEPLASRSTQVLTKDEANAMMADMVKNNTFIDFDIDDLQKAYSTRQTIELVEAEGRVMFYRFYNGIEKVNDRYIQTKTAKELAISSRLYNYYMVDIVDSFNKILDNLDERRKKGEDISNVYVSDLTDAESHNQLLRFQ